MADERMMIQHLHSKTQGQERMLTRMSRRLKAFSHHARAALPKAVGTVETAVAAGVAGVIQGHAGDKGSTIGPIPTDLGIGVALNLLGYFHVAGDQWSGHLNNFGDGFLAAYTSSIGFQMGRRWLDEGHFSFTSHALPPSGTAVKGEISPGQMADIVARVRAAAAQQP